jgi:hypothetical protein
MLIENYTTDIDIDQILVNTDKEVVNLNSSELTEEQLVIYNSFINKFGDKKYLIKNTVEFEITRFSNNPVSEETKNLNYNLISKTDKQIINDFLTLLPTSHE